MALQLLLIVCLSCFCGFIIVFRLLAKSSITVEACLIQTVHTEQVAHWEGPENFAKFFRVLM